MERLQYDTYGAPEPVQLAPFTMLQPKEDEIAVRVVAVGINPLDWRTRRGDMKMLTGWKFPHAMGTDFAGTVEDVGSRVCDLEPGDAVMGTMAMTGSGAFAPRQITRRDLVVRKPDTWSYIEAASLPSAGVTAWLALVMKAGLQRGQNLFINGATDAVGNAAIAIARDIGAKVTGRVGPRLITQARALGLSLALDETKPLPEALDGTFDVVFDVNGSLSSREGSRLIKRDGMIIDIAPTPYKFLRALLSLSRKVVIADVKAEYLQHVVDLATAHKLAIPMARTIALADAPALLASLQHGKRLDGKAAIAF